MCGSQVAQQTQCRPGLDPGPITTIGSCCATWGLQPSSTTQPCGYGSLLSQGRRLWMQAVPHTQCRPGESRDPQPRMLAVARRWGHSPLQQHNPVVMGPCFRVWSRVIGEGLHWGQVAEAFEASSVVVVDELGDEGVPIGMVDEGAPCTAALLFAANGFGDTAVEAFNETVGLRVVGPWSGDAGCRAACRPDQRGGRRTVSRPACSSCRQQSGR
ncbi:hypothetical protein ACVIF9_002246 [Bradyrhizobium sp. USDA 4350]